MYDIMVRAMYMERMLLTFKSEKSVSYRVDGVTVARMCAFIFPGVVAGLIIEYAKQYEFIAWARLYQFEWKYLARNPNSIDLLRANPDKIEWGWLSSNPSEAAIQLLSENPDKIDWDEVVLFNTGAQDLINANAKSLFNRYGHLRICHDNPAMIDHIRSLPIDLIDWIGLGFNPNATDMILANKEKYDSTVKSRPNYNIPDSSEIVIYHRLLRGDTFDEDENIPDIRDSYELISSNPNAMGWIRKHLDKICWRTLSRNPAAIDLLEANLQKIDHDGLSRNSVAIPFLMQHPEYVRIIWLARNPSIFELREPIGLRELLTISGV